jgi:hypothetical protein
VSTRAPVARSSCLAPSTNSGRRTIPLALAFATSRTLGESERSRGRVAAGGSDGRSLGSVAGEAMATLSHRALVPEMEVARVLGWG